MQLNSINYFVTIAQEKSISKAADKLFVSQPALSQYMKKIESELNTPLFVHGNRNFELTQAGEIFFQEGQVILQLYEQMMRRITSLANSNQEIVHFGISPFYSKYYLPKIIPHVLERYPWLQFNIIEEHSVYLEEKLAAGELDFCALPLYPKNPLLDYEVIHQEEIFLAVPRNHPVNALITPSSGISYIDLRLVRNEPFVSLKSIQKFSEMSHQLCAGGGFCARGPGKSAHHRKQSQLLPDLRQGLPPLRHRHPEKQHHFPPGHADHRLFPQGVSGWLIRTAFN